MVESPGRAVVDVARSAKDSSPMTAVSITAARADPTVGSTPHLPPQLVDIDPFDRMLLTTDGTVTTLLEACTGEPIVTRTTRQAGPATIDQLGADAGVWWHPDADLLELAPAEPAAGPSRRAARRARATLPTCSPSRSSRPIGCPVRSPTTSSAPGRRSGGCSPPADWRLGAPIVEIVAARADDVCDHMGVAASHRPHPPHLHDRVRATSRRRGDRMVGPRTPLGDEPHQRPIVAGERSP